TLCRACLRHPRSSGVRLVDASQRDHTRGALRPASNCSGGYGCVLVSHLHAAELPKLPALNPLVEMLRPQDGEGVRAPSGDEELIGLVELRGVALFVAA